jgi:hypothetical protein
VNKGIKKDRGCYYVLALGKLLYGSMRAAVSITDLRPDSKRMNLKLWAMRERGTCALKSGPRARRERPLCGHLHLLHTRPASACASQ